MTVQQRINQAILRFSNLAKMIGNWPYYVTREPAITADELAQIQDMSKNGMSNGDIAKKMYITSTAVAGALSKVKSPLTTTNS